jgi:transposase-like protein
MTVCLRCGSDKCIKNGSIHNGKPKQRCKTCGRQFVTDPQNAPITAETKALVDKLLLEKIPLAGIVRVTGVSERWLQYYVNDKYAHVSQQVHVTAKKKGV